MTEPTPRRRKLAPAIRLLLLAASLLLLAAAPATVAQGSSSLQLPALGESAPLEDSGLLLPELGDTASGIASLEQEHDIGQSWLRLYRSRVPESRDPLIYDYLQQLLMRLASHSALEERRLSLIVVSNPTLNAFAVPGGVVGVHTGLFLFADTEQQLSGVLAHELAHLSQRHWVRSVEKARQNRIPTMAGLLAGLALMATTGSDAGIAAIMATQAANLESQLRFSRENEAEADRVGMHTMVKADLDPRAIPAMFESMQRATRYMGERPPEFLLSHPVTEKRIADSRNRAEQFPLQQYTDNPDYQYIRARARLAEAENASVAARAFQNEMNGESNHPDASRYGLAIAQIAQQQYNEAEKTLRPLLDAQPDRLPVLLAQSEILLGQKRHRQALDITRRILQREPGNYPATMESARILEGLGEHRQSCKALESLLDKHRDNPAVWYNLAEMRGLAGDTGGVHTARAEYFILNGVFDKARQQLTYALKFYERDYMQGARIKQRLRELAEMEDQSMKI